MNSKQAKTSSHLLVVAVKENLAKFASTYSLNAMIRDQMSDVQNSIYSRLWKMIQQPISLDEIYQVVLKETHHDVALCEEEILSLVQMLAQFGLIDIRIEIKSA